jgi:hypothetical protein
MFDDPALTGALVGGLAGGLAVIIFALARKAPKCESCGAVQPKFRKPKNMTQAMWGGYTCDGCGKEIDARGRLRKQKA